MQSSNPPSFLLKLQKILANPHNEQIIRWDKFGTAISILCIHDLEHVILPQYFRHSKYSSFVRQLNMYGFSKRKSEKNAVAAFYHPCFSKGNIDFMGMIKKGKKQNKSDEQQIRAGKSRTCEWADQNPSLQECETQQSTKNIIFSAQPHTSILELETQKKLPEINQLIAEFSTLIQPYINTTIDSCSYHELQYLIKQPRFQRVNYAALGLMDWQQISPLSDISFGKVWSEKMQFIL